MGQIGSRFALTATDASAAPWMICSLGSVSVSVVLMATHTATRRSQIDALVASFSSITNAEHNSVTFCWVDNSVRSIAYWTPSNLSASKWPMAHSRRRDRGVGGAAGVAHGALKSEFGKSEAEPT